MTSEVTTLIDRYAEYLVAERRSPRTIVNYGYAIRGFARFLADRSITAATCADIVSYPAHVAAKGKSDSSVRVATYALRGFFHKILHRQDWSLARLPKPRRAVRWPEILKELAR
jgi:site-specific recombinase XerD